MTTYVDRCSEWRALASCHVDGELDELQTMRLENHLAGCVACRTWTRDVAGLAELLDGSERAQPARALELRRRTLRRRFAGASAVAATAASAVAAGVAAFALGLPGSQFSLFSSGGTPVASTAPCMSCMKKQAVTLAYESQEPVPVPPIHVANPVAEPDADTGTP